MEAFEFRFFDTAVELPWWWFGALVAWLALTGVFLWLFGRPLARPLFGLVGLGLGAFITWIVMGRVAPEADYAWAWLTGGGLVGALALGWILWRLVIALVLGGLVAVAAPWVVISLTALEPPPIWQPIAGAMREVREAVWGTVEAQTPEEGESAPASPPSPPPPQDGGAEADPADLPSITDPLLEGRDRVGEALSEWWDALSVGWRSWLIAAAAFGATAALLIGLIVPQLAAVLVTAFVGVLFLMPAVDWVMGTLPASATAWLRGPPRQTALIVVTATLVGALFQWIIFRERRPAKKK